MCNNIVRMIYILHTDMTRQLSDPTIQLQARGVHYPFKFLNLAGGSQSRSKILFKF